jgi:hypothetical protein
VNLRSHLTQRMQHLPPPLTCGVVIQRDLRVPMRDGAVLLADRWSPRSDGGGLPTALVRIPYGRTGLVAAQTARPLAERGFQVLVQSTRGTVGSDGPFDPLRREREDGLDTLDWVVKQPWFGEAIVLVGSSYLGFAQWAVADQALIWFRSSLAYGALADRVPLQTRPPHPRPGLQRRLPPVRPQPGHRRAQRHRHHLASRAAAGLSRPRTPVRGRPPGQGQEHPR